MADDGRDRQDQGADGGVLASLPATRPARLSRRARTATSGDGADTPRTAAAKPGRTATAKAKPAAAKSKAPGSAGRRKPTTPRAAAKAEPVAAPISRPKPVRPGTASLGEPAAKAGEARVAAVEQEARRGTDVVGTAVQAAGELAQLGLTIGGQLVKRAIDRLPKP